MKITLYALLSIYVLWIFFLAVMNLKRARDNKTLTLPALVLGYPILLIGYTIDVLVNLFLMTVLFVEIPSEWTVTGRLKKHIYRSLGWRQKVAQWFATNLLDAFDPDGKHC